MNRRRIGLAVLAGGAAAAWRHKQASRLHANEVSLEPEVVNVAEVPEPEAVLPEAAPLPDTTPSPDTTALPEVSLPAEPVLPVDLEPVDLEPAAVGAVVIPRADGTEARVAAPAAANLDTALFAAAAATDASAREDLDEPAVAVQAPSPQAPSPQGPTERPEGSELAPAGVGGGGDDSISTPWYRQRFYGWSIWSIALLGLIGAAAFAMSVWRTPYYRLQPGSVYDTIERVEAPGELVFVPDGDIGFVTVSQTANITPWQWLDAKLDKNVRIRHEDEVRGDQTADEARAVDLRRMTVSKNSAIVVALQKLGFDLITTPVGVEVARVFECSAADGTLGTGDLIVGVNGVATPDGTRLVEQLVSIGVDQEVELLVERIDPNNPTQSMRTDLVGLTLGSADDPCLEEGVRADEPRPFIGIMTETIFEEELPIDLEIRTGRVGGPSAGLAFTLAIMDVLSEGELTNGLNIVATGSIDRSGRVGPVGGIHQKTIAAERSGADVFIVPMCCDNFVDRQSGDPIQLPTNFEEAQMHAEDMIVIGVEDLDDALRAIGELGGNVDQFLTS